MQKIKAILALTRWNEIWDYTLATTLLAAVFAGVEWQWRIILIFLTNMLGQFFAFMINDIEDADDDALNPRKLKRNPVSNKSLSKKEAYWYAGITALLTTILFGVIASRYNTGAVIIIAITTLGTMFGYSSKLIRFKSMPVMDFLSHIYMLAGAPYLLAYFCFRSDMDTIGAIGLAIVSVISSYGMLENQIRDYATDKLTNIKNSTWYIGLKASKALRAIFAIIALGLIAYYISSLPQGFFIMVQVAGIFVIVALYPLIRYLLKKDLPAFKTDIHRALLVLGFIVLLLKIFHVL